MHRRRLFLVGVLSGCLATALVALTAQRINTAAAPVATPGPAVVTNRLLTDPYDVLYAAPALKNPDGSLTPGDPMRPYLGLDPTWGNTYVPVEPPRSDQDPPRSFNGIPFRIVPLAVATR